MGDDILNNKTKELLLERFEVISRAADDCTYILGDTSLSKEEIKNKLYIRFDRINDENQVLEGYLGAYFKESSNSVKSTTDHTIRSYV